MHRIWLSLIALLLLSATSQAQTLKGSLYDEPVKHSKVNEAFNAALARQMYSRIAGYFDSETSDLSSPVGGQVAYRSDLGTVKYYNSVASAWRTFADTTTAESPLTFNSPLSRSVNTISLTTVPLTLGGTGQTTAANAINALLPSQTSNSGKYLTTNGTVSGWGTVSAGVTCSGCTTNTLPKTTGVGTLGDSSITDAAGIVTINTTATGHETDINGIDAGDTAVTLYVGGDNGAPIYAGGQFGATSYTGGSTVVGDVSLATLTTGGNITVGGNILAGAVGISTVGMVNAPFGSIYLGIDNTRHTNISAAPSAIRIISIPDATGTVLLDSTSAKTLVCSNTAASTAITGTASKTYFNINCSIPANTLAAGKTITLDARGVYSAAAANTIVQTVDLCKVSGCGSGTVVNLATTSAATPGLVTNQGWLLNENHVVYTAGGTGTMDTQGYAAYQTAALVITFDPTQNTSTATIDTTAQQYLSIAVTWSSNSGSNTITLRNFKVVIQ